MAPEIPLPHSASGKSNAQVIRMNIESAVCFKYAPVTSAEAR
ncbi:hypothetical protein T05_8005 [Trichinella murrelli]|uniref:Uncharacterized protein n=1 Tax=Trichinella murrelli TaxID=144512 RepID=A0A0V0SU51_9BILA|nr:hypothetical protein T05_8005 [Trichinella murrelli]